MVFFSFSVTCVCSLFSEGAHFLLFLCFPLESFAVYIDINKKRTVPVTLPFMPLPLVVIFYLFFLFPATHQTYLRVCVWCYVKVQSPYELVFFEGVGGFWLDALSDVTRRHCKGFEPPRPASSWRSDPLHQLFTLRPVSQFDMVSMQASQQTTKEFKDIQRS